MPFPLELLPRDSGAEADLAEAIDVDDQPCLPVAEVDPDIREQRFGAERDLRFHPRDAVLEESDRGNRLGGGFAPRIAEVDRRPHLRDVSLLHALCECLEHLGFGRQPAVERIVEHGHGDVEVIAAGDVDDCAFESRHLDASDDGPMDAGNAVAADIDGLEPTVVARSDDFDLVSDGIGDREAVHEGGGDV